MVERPDVAVHGEVTVQNNPDQVVLLAAEAKTPRRSLRLTQIQQCGADPVGPLVEFSERQGPCAR